MAISSATVNYQMLRINPSSNLPVVSYRIGSTGVFVKRYDGSNWVDVGTTQPVAAGTVEHHSLAVGTNDTVYLAAYSGTGYTVYKSHVNASSATAWEPVGGSLFVAASNGGLFSASLALDAANRPYLAYRALAATPSLGRICVQKFNGTSWAPVGPLNFSTGGATDNISLAVTPSGQPCVSFRDAGATTVNSTNVMTYDGTNWISLGQVSTQTGSYSSVIIDNNGYPVVAFAEGAATNSGETVVKKYSNPIIAGPDSVRVTTTGNVAPIVTSNVNAAQGSTTFPLTATVYPSPVSQNVTWSIIPGGTANATVDAAGLMTVPAATSGIVWVKAVSTADASKSDSIRVQVYCKPANTNPINWFIFDTVRIAGTTLNHPSSGLGNANAYRFFPEGPTSTASLSASNTYTLQTYVSLSAAPQGNEYSYSMWIDYNRNGIFDSNEWTEITTNTGLSYTTKSFTIPATATPGKTLMRVRMRLAGGLNNNTSSCTGNVGSGQMQDYILNILPGTPPCALGDPATAPGSIGCVTFNYGGVSTTYTTVRGTDGNIWLQQNLGSSAVATSATDTAGYGDTFQWGRWDDSHQKRNAATAGVPAPNDPTGLGTGTTNFYTSSPNWWAGGALTDTWTATTPAGVTTTNGCDPCKALGPDWHLPSQTEWAGIVSSEGMTTIALAYSSNLKLPMGGVRNTSGGFDFVGQRGYYWSTTPSSTGGKYLYCGTTLINANAGGPRGQGMSIRCLKAAVATTVDSVKVGTSGNVTPAINTNAGTLQMTANVYPATVSQNVTWSIVPGTGAASISASGLVTAQSNGTIWAKAISVQDVTKKDSMLLTISNQIVAIDSIRVRTQGNVAANIITNAGALQLVATIYPATANQNVTWSIIPVSGTASINTAGLVTAQTNGIVWAKATSVQDLSQKDSLLITISNQSIVIDSIRVRTQGNVAANIITNAGALQLVATIYPATANQNVTWSIIPVSGTASINTAGLVTAQTNGTVWAKATSLQDVSKRDSILITISNQTVAVDSVDVRTQNNVAAVISSSSGTLQLVATVYPAATNQNVTWNIIPVSGTAIAGATGLVTALTNGTVWARATSVQDVSKKDSILITISNQNVGVGHVADEAALNVYPNPATGVLYITISTHHPAVQMVLTDACGKLISKRDFEADQLNSPYTMSMNSLSNGIYFLHITGINVSLNTKILKQ